MAADKPITLAVITGAHGVTGEVRLKLFGEGVVALKRYRAFNDSSSPLTLKKVRDDNKGGAIARFEEVTDRNAAEKLRGTELTVDRDTLPALGEGEYYHVDLLGLAAISDTGERLGSVISVENFGAGDILEIECPPEGDKRGKRFMVPMQEHAIPEWDDERVVIAAAFLP